MIYDTIKFFNLEDFADIIEDVAVRKTNNRISCYVTLKKKFDPCPECNSNNITIHGYYQKQIAHSVSTGSPCFLIYKARRYKCKFCGKVFYEKNPFSYGKKQVSTYVISSLIRILPSSTRALIFSCVYDQCLPFGG
ncbi:MAG: transposase family protein [Bacilli bacterium]